MTRILLIEDEPLISRMYSHILKKAGFEITQAANGPDGLRLAEEVKPDLILLDIMMPLMNGLEVLQRLKEKATLKDIPVLMLTNLSEQSEVRAASMLGAVNFMVKIDTDPQVLVAKINEILTNQKN